MFSLSKYIGGPIFTEFCDCGELVRLDTAVCNHLHRRLFHDQIDGQTTVLGTLNHPVGVPEVGILWLKARNLYAPHYMIETPLLNVFNENMLSSWFKTLAHRTRILSLTGENGRNNNVIPVQRVALTKRAGKLSSDKKGWEMLLESVTPELTALTVTQLTARPSIRLKSLYDLLHKSSHLTKLTLDCVPGLDVHVVRMVLTECSLLAELHVTDCFTSSSDILPSNFEVSYPIKCSLKCVVWKSGLLKLLVPVLESDKTGGLQSIVVDMSRGVGDEVNFKGVLMSALKRSKQTLLFVTILHVTPNPLMFGFELMFSMRCCSVTGHKERINAPLNYVMKNADK